MRGTRPPGRGGAFGAALALILLLGACSSDSSDGAEATTSSSVTASTTTTEPEASTSAPEPDTTTSAPDTGPGTIPAIGPADGPGILEFRPVLSVQPCPTVVMDPDDPVSTETTVPDAPSLTPDAAGEVCYQLGPVGADGTDLATATTTTDVTGSWVVTVETSPESTATMNDLFNACQRSEPSCPGTGGSPGQMAIVVRGIVVSAPSVQALDLADDPFTISGSFSEQQARDLATLLDG